MVVTDFAVEKRGGDVSRTCLIEIGKAFDHACKRGRSEDFKFRDRKRTTALKIVIGCLDIMTDGQVLGRTTLRMTERNSLSGVGA